VDRKAEGRGRDGSEPAERHPIRVALADKNPLVRAGLKQLLIEDERFELVATASDGERFLEAIDRVEADVGVIGWVMPYLDGFGVLKALRRIEDAPPVVVYTGADSPIVVREVMTLGGAGFTAKSDPPEQLLDSVAAVAQGRMVFPFMDLRRLNEDPLAQLTPREREFLVALASGRTNAQLAHDFGTSVNTVKFHLKNLYDKLAVRNRAQAVALHLGGGPR
jgi:two-component system nitrate/nitrite response regulator NarP